MGVLKQNIQHMWGVKNLTTVLQYRGTGIRQWTINLYTSPMMIDKNTPSFDYRYWLKSSTTTL